MGVDKQLMKGSMKIIVLQILAGAPSHGYGISTKVKKLSSGEISITEGTLYPLLHSLEADGFITSKLEFQGDRKKKVYTLTEQGEKLLNDKKKEWKSFSKIIDGLLAS